MHRAGPGFPGKEIEVVAPARTAAAAALDLVDSRRRHSDDVLNSDLVAGLEIRDRNLVTEIVLGTLRWRGWLDHILAAGIDRDLEAVESRVLSLLRMSLYQMSRMDRIPDHAIIHDAVDLAKVNLRKGAAGFVNGVLRNLARQRPWRNPEFHRDCPLWDRVSLPRWLWQRWEDRYGTDRACEYALSLNRAPRSAFRFAGPRAGKPTAGEVPPGRSRDDSPFVRPFYTASEIVPGACLLEVPQTGAWRDDVRFQDEASQLIPYLLDPREGSIVWDACAAPGGKAAILRENLGESGYLIASEKLPLRAARLRTTLSRVGGAKCDLLVLDAGSPPPFRGQFDAVLADVPCSGLGTLRPNPELKWRIDPGCLPDFSRRQSAILGSVACSVRVGGLLLYATCSTEPEENEGVVEAFLGLNHGFHLVRPSAPPGISAWIDATGMFRSYPSPRIWDGFFAALMVRTS